MSVTNQDIIFLGMQHFGPEVCFMYFFMQKCIVQTNLQILNVQFKKIFKIVHIHYVT